MPDEKATNRQELYRGEVLDMHGSTLAEIGGIPGHDAHASKVLITFPVRSGGSANFLVHPQEARELARHLSQAADFAEPSA